MTRTLSLALAALLAAAGSASAQEKFTFALNWFAVPDASANPCTWKAERFSGFFVAGASGPERVTEGQDHPLALTAVLADKTGAKVLVAEGPGEYSAYDLGGGKPVLGHHLVWLRPDPESYEIVDHLGPVCDEDGR